MPQNPSETVLHGATGPLRQAPVAPLHDDGVRAFALGTLLFAAALVVLLLFGNDWQVSAWWTQVAATGVGIGAIGTAYCVWRRNKRAKDAALGIPPPTA